MRFSGVSIIACLVLTIALGCRRTSSVEPLCAVGVSSEPQEESATAMLPPAGSARAVQFGRAFAEAVESGRKQSKPLMVFFGAKWCRFCKAMEEESFRDPAVVELSKQFVCVAVDFDVEPGLCHDFGVHTLPTVLFTSSSGIPMNRQVGESTPSELAGQMEAALRADTARHQIEGAAALR